MTNQTCHKRLTIKAHIFKVIKREISEKNEWHSYITWQYHVFPTCQFRLTIIHFLISEKGNNLVNMEVIVAPTRRWFFFKQCLEQKSLKIHTYIQWQGLSVSPMNLLLPHPYDSPYSQAAL
jgi:hypothetical protein